VFVTGGGAAVSEARREASKASVGEGVDVCEEVGIFCAQPWLRRITIPTAKKHGLWIIL
jgi:hypothetical protein